MYYLTIENIYFLKKYQMVNIDEPATARLSWTTWIGLNKLCWCENKFERPSIGKLRDELALLYDSLAAVYPKMREIGALVPSSKDS